VPVLAGKFRASGLVRNKSRQTLRAFWWSVAPRSGIVAGLTDADLELLPRYCRETNISYEAVQLMPDLGFPVAHTELSHGYSPLHNAAWCGDAALVDLFIARGHPLDLVDPRCGATPPGYAIHGWTVEKRHPEGQFACVVESLLGAGSPWDRSSYPTGNPELDVALSHFAF
jgi:hypothetical protein